MSDIVPPASPTPAALPAKPVLRGLGRHASLPPFQLRKSIVLAGRRAGCAVRMHSDEVSDVHAAFVTTHGVTYVADLSQTATYVNDAPILEAELRHGDRVRLGPYEFQFDAPFHADTPRGASPVHVIGHLDGARPDQKRPIDCTVFTIGRRNDADLRLSDQSVSHLHAIIVAQSGGHAILDLGSRSGTLVNGKKVGLHELQDGDIIRIGPETLRYSLAGQEQAAAAARAPAAAISQPQVISQSAADTAAHTELPAKAEPPPQEDEWPRLAPVVGHRRRRGVLLGDRAVELPEPAAQHPDLEISEAEQSMEPPASELQHQQRPILGLLLTSLLLLAGASAAIWHFMKSGFSVQGAMSFQLATETDVESASVQRMQEVLLSDSLTRDAAIAQLPEGMPPGFLAGGGDFVERATVQWQRPPTTPDQARLLVTLRGRDEADSIRVAALMKAVYEANLKTGSGELARLQSELAAIDEQVTQREQSYLEQRLKELQEEVRVLEVTSPDADAIAAMRKAVADARARHQRAVEERIRSEVKQGRAPEQPAEPAAASDKDDSSTQPAKSIPRISRVPHSIRTEEKEAEQALQAAEDELQKVLAAEQQLQTRRANLQSVQKRLEASKLTSKPGAGSRTSAQRATAQSRPLPPERIVIVPDPDKRGWWIAGASVATAVLFAMALSQTRSSGARGQD